ncbi:hypothetical protein N8J89_08155 [Crossiella sp. CA-258035]|uniref:hypothetical protein n=1 Tax=Crossiella sp. CA-258035 TaxID=2981138 RepID=UPI0024BC0B24|nr:hypothetical protein [Crossiella sp. CA-258035]WHT21028.1 hypothetical protein N8J89_08155 [Crossiella sp. CA-258035]
MSAIALTGVLLANIHGLLIERAGLLGLTLMLLGFGAVLVGLHGLRATQFGLLVVAIGAANIFRIRQIRQDIAQIQVAMQSG